MRTGRVASLAALCAALAVSLAAVPSTLALRSAPTSPSLVPWSVPTVPPRTVVVAVGYLGDLAVASPVRSPRGSWSIALRFRRHYSSSLGFPQLVPVGTGPVEAFAVALDYRAETLLVWAAGGGVFARVLPAAGAAGAIGAPAPVHRLGATPSVPEVAAVFSDDGHGIVAWRTRSATPSGAQLTSIELGLLRIGSHGPPTRTPLVVERFRDPPSFPPPEGSLRLIRLPSEAVRMAWAGLEGGRYVVRASPVSLRRGAWAPVVVSPAAGSLAAGEIPPTALACCLGLAPLYASIESSAIRIGTPLAACLK